LRRSGSRVSIPKRVRRRLCASSQGHVVPLRIPLAKGENDPGPASTCTRIGNSGAPSWVRRLRHDDTIREYFCRFDAHRINCISVLSIPTISVRRRYDHHGTGTTAHAISARCWKNLHTSQFGFSVHSMFAEDSMQLNFRHLLNQAQGWRESCLSNTGSRGSLRVCPPKEKLHPGVPGAQGGAANAIHKVSNHSSGGASSGPVCFRSSRASKKSERSKD
jgi:hypothetical protein